jgi:hypothetical protein
MTGMTGMTGILDYVLDRILLPPKTAPSKWEKFRGHGRLGDQKRLTPALASCDVVAVLVKAKVGA